MSHVTKSWLIAGLLVGTMAYALAEDITLTTYYPSPRGVYDELRANTAQFGQLTLTSNGDLTVNGNTILGDASSDTLTFNASTVTIPNGLDMDAGTLVIDASNDVVGIGITTPNSLYKLDVNGIVNATALYENGMPFAGGVPSGAVMFFALSACPAGWSPFSSAVGRYVVGTTQPASVGRIVGQALGDMENRPAGEHNHVVIDPGHYHLVDGAWTGSTPGMRPYDFHCCGQPLTATTGIAVGGVSGGAVIGTNAPYIQLLACQKD